MKKINDLTEDELYFLGEIVFQYDDLNRLKNDIERIIKIKIDQKDQEYEKSLNVRFNMEMFIKLQIFDPAEFNVIKNNHINNMQELIDCNLDSLVGITPSIKEGLEWVRNTYDMEKSQRRR